MNNGVPQFQLAFSSVENFCRWFDRLKQGVVFLRMKKPLPKGTTLTLSLDIPHVPGKVRISGVVSESRQVAEGKSGVKMNFQKQGRKLIPAIEKRLRQYPAYCRALGLSSGAAKTTKKRQTAPVIPKETKSQTRRREADSPDGSRDRVSLPAAKSAPPEPGIVEGRKTAGDLSLDWLYEAVTQPEKALEQKDAETVSTEVPLVSQKSRLTAEERAQLEPVGVFVRDLTKAMLKSGYYAPDHPGGQGAKQGLYAQFKAVVGQATEIMITNREAREKSEILISGVMDEPVSIALLVGESAAELFAPKLQEYCRRKRLVSFAIKRDITSDQFEAFVDIMSDPKVDTVDDKKVGAYLTAALVEHGITEISTVFLDDFISLETDLPWRVEMAIQRLTKDLHVLPMMKDMEEEQFTKLKQNIVQDIIRPLQHPRLLNDLLINCYIIARHVEDMDTEDIERIIVEAFRFDMLMPTVHLTFEEFDRLQDKRKEAPDNKVLIRRIAGIKRILRLIAARVVTEESALSQQFITTLYDRGLMSFKDLPGEVQYVINTRRITDDLRKNSRVYLEGLAYAEAPKEVIIYLKSFRRAVPLLVENDEWPLLVALAEAVVKAGQNKKLFTVDRIAELIETQGDEIVQDEVAHELFIGVAADPVRAAVIYIFKEAPYLLAAKYGQMITGAEWLTENRRHMERILFILGPLGVDILSRILLEEDNNAVRQASVEVMVGLGPPARSWALLHLAGSEDRSWKLRHSALYVLARCGEGPDDFEVVRPFLADANISLRLAAMEVAARLCPPDMETLLVDCLTDENEKIRGLAIRLLGHFVAPVSEAALNHILSKMEADPAVVADPEMHLVSVERLLNALTAMDELPLPEHIETKVIALIARYDRKGSRWKRLLSGKAPADYSTIVEMAMQLLIRIGGQPSEDFLYSLIRAKSPHAESALAALEKMEKRPG